MSEANPERNTNITDVITKPKIAPLREAWERLMTAKENGVRGEELRRLEKAYELTADTGD